MIQKYLYSFFWTLHVIFNLYWLACMFYLLFYCLQACLWYRYDPFLFNSLTLPWLLDHYKDRVAFGTTTLCRIILLVVFSHFDVYRIQLLAGNLAKYLYNFYLKNWKAYVFFLLPFWLFLRLSKWLTEARALFMHVFVSWVYVTQSWATDFIYLFIL